MADIISVKRSIVFWLGEQGCLFTVQMLLSNVYAVFGRDLTDLLKFAVNLLCFPICFNHLLSRYFLVG